MPVEGREVPVKGRDGTGEKEGKEGKGHAVWIEQSIGKKTRRNNGMDVNYAALLFLLSDHNARDDPSSTTNGIKTSFFCSGERKRIGAKRPH